MKPQKIFLLVVAFLILGGMILSLNSVLGHHDSSFSGSVVSANLCPVRYENQTVEGTSMMPLIKPGTNITSLYGYYDCHNVNRGDIVLYNYSGDPHELIKQVMAVPGDNWSLENRSSYFLIIVDGKILKNSAGNPYEIPRGNRILPLYVNSYPTIPKNTYLILGDQVRGSLDSTVFGLVAKKDITAKVLLNN